MFSGGYSLVSGWVEVGDVKYGLVGPLVRSTVIAFIIFAWNRNMSVICVHWQGGQWVGCDAERLVEV